MIKDLKEIIRLSKEVDSSGVIFDSEDEELNVDNADGRTDNVEREKKKENPWKTFSNRSPKRSKPETNLKRRVVEEYNCTECFFQGSSADELKTHITIKHTIQGGFKCRNCGDSFRFKPNLMDHRKSEHSSTVAPCRNNLRGACSYTSNMCWWNHTHKK